MCRVQVVSMMLFAVTLTAAACRRDDPGESQPAPEPATATPAVAETPATSDTPEAAPPNDQSADSAQDTPDPPSEAAPSVSATSTDVSAASTDAPARPVRQAVEVLRPVGDELLARWNDIQSVSAKLDYVYRKQSEPRMYQDGTGTRDSLRRPDGKVLVRSVMTNQIRMEQEEDAPYPWILTFGRVRKFSDGEFVHVVNETKAGTTVVKQRATPGNVMYIGGPVVLREMIQMDKLQQKPDTTVNGRDCYVFVGRSSAGNIVTRHFIDKETGIRVKLVVERRAEDITSETILSEIELNPEFPPDHFEFTPPEGVEIQDLTVPGAVYRPAGSEPSDTGAAGGGVPDAP